jgi:murein DD-endopeptidase MepM/ murein hydrolase activator NlpD
MKLGMFTYKNNREAGMGRIGLILGLPFIILILAFAVYKLFLIDDPEVNGIEALEVLSADKTVTITGTNIKNIKINIYKNGRTVELLNDAPEYSDQTYTLQIKPKDLKLEDGPAVISIEASAGLLKKISYEVSAVIDTVPPKLDVLRAPSLIEQGSAGVAVLRAKDADSVYIKLGDLNFKAYEVETEDDFDNSGEDTDRPRKALLPTYYAFFPAPHNIEEAGTYYAIAEDSAGNQKVKSLPTRMKLKEYRTSRITIDDTFINTVIAPLLNETDIADPAAAFKEVNEDWRRESHDKIMEIANDAEPKVMWEGRFLQMRNSKVMATYGDRREYIYDGNVISKSAHLGYDLASYANAPFQASNTGIVKYAGDLSIYGKTVIIDHGLGLMSIYGHLSEISVEEEEVVQKGDTIGRTGSSGLAGGDHLHFGVLVNGYEVSPLYWWDSRWLDANILNHLTY